MLEAGHYWEQRVLLRNIDINRRLKLSPGPTVISALFSDQPAYGLVWPCSYLVCWQQASTTGWIKETIQPDFYNIVSLAQRDNIAEVVPVIVQLKQQKLLKSSTKKL